MSKFSPWLLACRCLAPFVCPSCGVQGVKTSAESNRIKVLLRPYSRATPGLTLERQDDGSLKAAVEKCACSRSLVESRSRGCGLDEQQMNCADVLQCSRFALAQGLPGDSALFAPRRKGTFFATYRQLQQHLLGSSVLCPSMHDG